MPRTQKGQWSQTHHHKFWNYLIKLNPGDLILRYFSRLIIATTKTLKARSSCLKSHISTICFNFTERKTAYNSSPVFLIFAQLWPIFAGSLYSCGGEIAVCPNIFGKGTCFTYVFWVILRDNLLERTVVRGAQQVDSYCPSPTLARERPLRFSDNFTKSQ